MSAALCAMVRHAGALTALPGAQIADTQQSALKISVVMAKLQLHFAGREVF